MAHFTVHESPSGKLLGAAHSHQLPRIGEGLEFQNNTHRVLDVFHPTQEQRNVGIYLPRVLVRVEDIRWMDPEVRDQS